MGTADGTKVLCPGVHSDSHEGQDEMAGDVKNWVIGSEGGAEQRRGRRQTPTSYLCVQTLEWMVRKQKPRACAHTGRAGGGCLSVWGRDGESRKVSELL